MPVTVKQDLDDGIIRVLAWGDVTIDEMTSAKARVIELHHSKNISKVLVDGRHQTSAPSAVELIEFTSSWPIELRAARIAPEPFPEEIEFLETAAANRGRSVRNFKTEQEALDWLNQS